MAKFWRTVGIVAAFLLFISIMWKAVFVTSATAYMTRPDAGIYEKAVMAKTFGLCEKIGGITTRDECYRAIASELRPLNDYEACEKILSVRGRDVCFYSFAMLDLSHPLCDRISDTCYDDKSHIVDDDGCLKNGCHDILYIDAASKTGDVSVCDGLVRSESNRKTCYYHVATATKNAGLCDLTHDEETVTSCVFDIATSTKNLELCEKIGDVPFRITCTASITGDMKLCDGPDIDGFKTTCIRGACAAKAENRKEPACIAVQNED